jgi:hypothetical protein
MNSIKSVEYNFPLKYWENIKIEYACAQSINDRQMQALVFFSFLPVLSLP